MSKVLTLFKSGWFIALVGVLLLCLLVWLGGPYLGIGSAQPLASPVSRLLTIVVIIAIWAIWLQVLQLRNRNKTRQMSGELAGQDAAASGHGGSGDDRDERSEAERGQLRERFQEAVETLRRNRRGSRNLYTLPWYVVIGPPGSGKSTLLQNSGLNFPLSERFGKEALRGVGGTRNCDWWFTDEAVFLDTAGRYTTQDSDRQTDASAWVEFLRLLRRYRKRRPINGVLIAMSMSDLMTLDERERQAHVQAIRKRLDELGEHLKIAVPVYLVFTKCDLVAGFTEFFDDLEPDLRSQVWGVSFPIAQTMDGSAAKAFADEYALLLERLATRLLERLHGERDPARRAAILSFPQQLAALRDITRQFVEGVFGAHSYGRPPLLRGAYLTSGTQEGAPIDRMMAAVARTFGVDAAQVRASGARQRTFFVERLLRDVVFGESGFAGTNPALERRKVIMQVAAYTGAIALTVLLLFGLATSYARNRSYLGRVHKALAAYPADTSLTDASTQKQYFARVLERLEGVGAARRAAMQYQDDVPWLMRFGLYQGNDMTDQVDAAYLRELNGILLPGVAAQFRRGLVAHADNPELLYDYLKGYLMLGEPRHLNAAQLETLTDMEWSHVFPDNRILQQAMAGHFKYLVARPGRLRALALDSSLVQQARSTLRTADLDTLIYGNLKLGAESAGYEPLRLDKELGLLGGVFRRRSGKPLSAPFPALFTQTVFRHEVEKGIAQAVDQFAADDWVLGQRHINSVQKAQLQQQVLTLYQRDYIKAWDGLLADLELQPIGSIQDASVMAAKLSGPSSPLKALLQLVRRNTHDLMRAPGGAGGAAGGAAAAAAKRAAASAASRNALTRALASASGGSSGGGDAPKPGDAISEHFDTLDKLTEGSSGATPIDHTLNVLAQLSKTLLTMTDFSDASGQPNPQLLMARQQAAQLPPPVSAWVAALTGKSEDLVASGAKGALGQQFQQAAGQDCAQTIHDRYPFWPHSRSEVPLQNFAELFGNGGRFDSFFKQNLAKLVDTSGRHWHWKTGPGAVSGPPGLLAEAEAADHIRRMYFRGGASPEVDFTLRDPQLDPAIGRLVVKIGGQSYTYPGDGSSSAQLHWPGPKPGTFSIAAFGSDGSLLGRFSYQGDWAFFRALAAGGLKRRSDLQFQFHFNFGGHQAVLVLQASNLNNPFLNTVVPHFRCRG